MATDRKTRPLKSDSGRKTRKPAGDKKTRPPQKSSKSTRPLKSDSNRKTRTKPVKSKRKTRSI